MKTSESSVTIERPWEPIPKDAWDEAAARHLLLRAGFSATPPAIKRALSLPVEKCVAELFEPAPPLPPTGAIQKIHGIDPRSMKDMRSAAPEQRKEMRDERRDLERAGYEELGIAWLQRAAEPRHSAAEKFVLFLQDIFVIGFSKVRNPALLHAHQQLLRELGTRSYPELCKAVSRSPAMIIYLDLQQSKAGAPNENFARELFELFTLGEGNYTEDDIKQAARAFTGYRQRAGEFIFQRRAHDAGRKQVFGETGTFDGDQVIDLVFKQPAAATFLPRELVRFYLTDRGIDETHIESLGKTWRSENFNTGALLRRFFTSRMFFEPSFRGGMIKSPVQFQLGLVQDLGLDVAPLPRFTLGSLRQMGQPFFNPPNVRGWVGGQHWINSSTLAARRQLVEFLLRPLPEGRLNADEKAALEAAGKEGRSHFTVEDTSRLIDDLGGELEARLDQALSSARNNNPKQRAALERRVLAVLLQSPRYNLC
ncbi:MAG: DUF1800 domain-containing protein [Opitutaceae bacterium]